MEHYLNIFVKAIFVENLALGFFLGMCTFLAVSKTVKTAFGLGLAEYHSGYMLYSKRAMREIPYDKLSGSFDFDLEMLVLARVKGLRVKQLPIPTIYADEVSHLNPVQYGFDVLGVVWDYKRGKYDKL